MHKRIGILGGMSPESTVEYYQYITRAYTKRFGDYGYPEVIIYSVSFQPYVDWPEQDRWDLVAQGLSEAAQILEAAGADFIVIATNTMHLVFDQVQASVSVPMLSLLDAVGDAILERFLCLFCTSAQMFRQGFTPSPSTTRKKGHRKEQYNRNFYLLHFLNPTSIFSPSGTGGRLERIRKLFWAEVTALSISSTLSLISCTPRFVDFVIFGIS